MNLGNLIIILAVFGYAGWALYRAIKKSKEGKCASCSPKEGCGCENTAKHDPTHPSNTNT